MLQIIVDFGTAEVFGRAISFRIYGYGLMLVLGFLVATWLAQWRAKRMGEDPEAVTRVALLALIGGVVGARLAYVVENWSRFRRSADPVFEIFDISSGGLIYYGGLLLATGLVIGYVRIRKLPVRRFIDIVAPSIMIGLAFGRAGCLLNGCCYGARCRPEFALAARFPMYSRPLVNLSSKAGPFSGGAQGPCPAYAHQLHSGDLVPDVRLVNAAVSTDDDPVLLPPSDLHGKLDSDQLAVMFGTKALARRKFDKLAGADGLADEQEWRRGRSAADGFLRGSEAWSEAKVYASIGVGGDVRLGFDQAWRYLSQRHERLLSLFDADGDGELAGSERARANEYLQADLFAMAARQKSLPIMPAQALGLANALVLAFVLFAFHRLRRRDGQVFALLLVLYPVTRFVLELIRDDNEHHVARLDWTHNQWTSLAMLAAGVIMFVWLQRMSPSAGPTGAERVVPSGAAGLAIGGKTRTRTGKSKRRRRR